MPRWAWLATLVLACGRPANTTETPRSPGPTAVADAGVDAHASLADDLPRLALAAKAMYSDWAAAVKDPQLDCPAATARINALADKYAEVIAANRAVLKAGRAKVRAFRAELEKYEAEMQPVAKSITESPVMSRCAPNPDFAKAIDRLQGDT